MLAGENLMPSVGFGTTNTVQTKLRKKRGRPKKIKTNTIDIADIKAKVKKTRKKWTRRAKKAGVVDVAQPTPTRTSGNPIHLSEATKTSAHYGFTVKETIDIIETCNRSNVSEFRYMGLVLYFSGQVAMPDQPKTFSETSERKTQEKSSMPSIRTWQREALEENIALADLQVSDPIAYEQAMIDRMAKENELDEGENG